MEEKVDQLHMDQADNDFFVFAELVKDYITLIGAVKVNDLMNLMNDAHGSVILICHCTSFHVFFF